MHKDLGMAPLGVVVREMGQRFERYRISRNIKQDQLARMAGLSRTTVSKLEAGGGATLDTVARVLRALGLQERLLQLVPDAGVSPLDPASARAQPRRRVRTTQADDNDAEPWTWGVGPDEERSK